MPQEIKIKVNSVQQEDGQTHKINYTTKGTLYVKKDVYYLKYQENLGDLKGVKTTLKVKEDKVTLIRQGKLRMIQDFIYNQSSSFDYNTPYGSFKFSIKVNQMETSLSPKAGEIQLGYELHNNSEKINDNQLNITYKEE